MNRIWSLQGVSKEAYLFISYQESLQHISSHNSCSWEIRPGIYSFYFVFWLIIESRGKLYTEVGITWEYL